MRTKEKIVPTLDTVGWVRHGVREKLDRLLSNFFTSDGMQSSMYYRMFKTYQVINQENVEQVENMRSELESYLSNYLSKYFDAVDVQVFFCDNEGNIKELYELEYTAGIGLFLRTEVRDQDESDVIEKPIRYQDGLFKYVLDKFNGF